MKQIIMKDKRIVCVTGAPYPSEVIKQMKAAGYKITIVKEDNDEHKSDGK